MMAILRALRVGRARAQGQAEQDAAVERIATEVAANYLNERQQWIHQALAQHSTPQHSLDATVTLVQRRETRCNVLQRRATPWHLRD